MVVLWAVRGLLRREPGRVRQELTEPDLADLDQHPAPQLVRRVLGARPRDERLHRALEVVALQARVAGVEVPPHGLEVGVVQLVVEQVDDLLEEVGALVGHELLPSRPAGRRSFART